MESSVRGSTDRANSGELGSVTLAVECFHTPGIVPTGVVETPLPTRPTA
jgi:hypothetical protein